LEIAVAACAGFPGNAPVRFDFGAGRRFALRLDLEMRFWGLETNKDRRAGLMFKRRNARDYWRSQKASSTAGARGGRRIPADVDVIPMGRNNPPTTLFRRDDKGRLICADLMGDVSF
jgi:hypothetical protein